MKPPSRTPPRPTDKSEGVKGEKVKGEVIKGERGGLRRVVVWDLLEWQNVCRVRGMVRRGRPLVLFLWGGTAAELGVTFVESKAVGIGCLGIETAAGSRVFAIIDLGLGLGVTEWR